MKRQPGQCRDTGGIKDGHRVAPILVREARLERRACLRHAARLEREPPTPGLEHLVGPALTVAPRRLETVIGDGERSHVVVEDALDLASPHVAETEALVIAGT